MELCSSGHDEVCFEGRRCPVCSAQNDLDNANGEIGDLKKKIDSHEDKNSELY